MQLLQDDSLIRLKGLGQRNVVKFAKQAIMELLCDALVLLIVIFFIQFQALNLEYQRQG